MLEACRPGQQHGPEPRQIGHFAFGNLCHHRAAQRGVARLAPQPSRLHQRVGHPHVGVRGRVRVKLFPCTVFCLAPQPARQAMRQAAARHVPLRPVEHPVKRGAVVAGQRKEQGVGLAFRSGAVAAAMVDHPALRIDEVRAIGLPQRPRALLASARRAKRQQQDDQQPMLAQPAYTKAHGARLHAGFQARFARGPQAGNHSRRFFHIQRRDEGRAQPIALPPVIPTRPVVRRQSLSPCYRDRIIW